MKFIVTGANPKTGTELTREIEAVSAKDAEKIAHDKGLLVSEVKPVATIQYAQPQQQPAETESPAPAYTAMLALAALLSVFAVVCYVLGGLAVVMAATNAVNKTNRDNIPMLLASGLGAVMYGLIIHAIGTALRAVRDIAINSFD